MTDTADRFWSDIKKETAASLLTGSVGMVAKGKNCVIIYTRSPNTIFIPIRNDDEAKLLLWGLGGTGSDAREFTSELNQFLTIFKIDVSPRDINLALVSDFISTYLTENLYKRKSERALALEFILGQVSDGEAAFSLIDFKGEVKLWGPGSRFFIIGGAGKKRDELRAALSKLKFQNLYRKRLAAALKPLLRGFRGDTQFAEFFLDQLKKRKKGKI